MLLAALQADCSAGLVPITDSLDRKDGLPSSTLGMLCGKGRLCNDLSVLFYR